MSLPEIAAREEWLAARTKAEFEAMGSQPGREAGRARFRAVTACPAGSSPSQRMSKRGPQVCPRAESATRAREKKGE
jgi:hypothetical protein